MFFKGLVAVFMALAIANPACCCTLMAYSQGNAGDTSPCCSDSDTSQNPADSNRHCLCSLAKEKAAPDHDATLPELIHNLAIVPRLSVKDFSDHFPRIALATSSFEKWPPGSFPVPTHSKRLAAKCSYRI